MKIIKIFLIVIILCSSIFYFTGCSSSSFTPSDSNNIKASIGIIQSEIKLIDTNNREIFFDAKKGDIIKYTYDSKVKKGTLIMQLTGPGDTSVEFENNKSDTTNIVIDYDGQYMLQVKYDSFIGYFKIYANKEEPLVNDTIDGDIENQTTNQESIDRKGEKAIQIDDTNVDLSKFNVTDPKDSASSILSGFTTNEGKHYRKFFFNKFSGVRTFGSYSKNVTIDYTSNIENGKLNVVILDSNNNIIKVLETNKSESILLNFGETEEYIIKAVGDEARKGDVEIQVK